MDFGTPLTGETLTCCFKDNFEPISAIRRMSANHMASKTARAAVLKTEGICLFNLLSLNSGIAA
jgi:hypothetical protein